MQKDIRLEAPSASTSAVKSEVLVLLYGDYDYDGRARRLVAALGVFGRVTVLDVAAASVTPSEQSCDLKRVRLEAGWGNMRKHLIFWRECLKWTWVLKPTVVVAAGFFAAFPGRLATSLGRCLYVYDPYELIIPEHGVRMSGRERVWYLLERFGIASADRVIAANSFRAAQMKKHYGLTRLPVVFQNIPILNPFHQPILAAGLLPSRADYIRVLYQGDMNLSRGIRRFIEAAKHFPDTLQLILAGDGPDLGEIRAEIARMGLTQKILCLGRIPNKELPGITRECQIGIVTYPYKGLNNIYCASNKIFEYGQAGLAVVATDQPPLQELIAKYGIGRLVSEHDTPAMLSAVITEIAVNLERYTSKLASFVDAHPWEDEICRLQASLGVLIRRAE
jgi:glycosyltransferase involved in cell wall biosynthesis